MRALDTKNAKTDRALRRCAAAALVLVSAITSTSAQSSGVHIVVVEGKDAVNIVQQKTAVAPVVEVRDRNDQPVAGAVVRFAVTRGRATFNGARTLTVATNAAGRAAATGFAPTGAGARQVTASATFQGQTIAAATIAQTNVMTAAEAATASATGSTSAGAAGAGSGGAGGGLSTTTLAVVGGAAAGGAIAATEVLGGGGSGSARYSGTFSGPFTEFWPNSNPVPPNTEFTETLTFAGTLSGSQITGTVTVTVKSTVGPTVVGSGTATYPIVLR